MNIGVPVVLVLPHSTHNSSSVSSKGTDCCEFSPPCGSPLFSPVIIAKSGVHQGGGFSQELLPHPTSGHDPKWPLSPSSRASTMMISSDSEVTTSPSAPDYPPLKRSFAIHPGVYRLWTPIQNYKAHPTCLHLIFSLFWKASP